MAVDTEQESNKLTFRAFEDGEHQWENWQDAIFSADHSHKCPTYVHRTPPCQGSCPSGEDVRGWLQIVKGVEKPPVGMDWEEYAFRRSTNANPFPAMMGRVCPAPCEDGCNRNDVEDYVGINSIEQFIGDTAFDKKYTFSVDDSVQTSTKKVAIIGGGPAGLAAAFQLRRKGHGSVIFDDHEELGGMMRYGIPGYRTPRAHLDHEIKRILDLGDIDVRTGVRVGKDISVEDLDREFDAVLWAIGCQTGRKLPVPGADAPNCVSGVKFLEAFNQGILQVTSDRVVCVGGGDTSIDVVSVARRLGKIKNINKSQRPEAVIGGYVAHDSAYAALREGAEVTLTSLFPREQMTASEEEVEDALHEGVDIHYGAIPVEVIKNDEGRAVALRMAKCEFEKDGRPIPVEGTEFEIECDLIVSAIGQGGNLEGLEEFDNGRGLMDADKFYQHPQKKGHFVAGDIVRPHLLTTAIGQASIAADSIDYFLKNDEPAKRPKVDVRHFNLLDKLRESDLAPEGYDHQQEWGTCEANFAVHNYEDRSAHEIIPSEKLFLGHFAHTPRNKRESQGPGRDEVLSHFEERLIGLTPEVARKEADRCMSCGMCFECDNCVIYCPQDAVFRVKTDQSTLGRYVDTDYNKCIGCHICADVCPTGYIEMGMGSSGLKRLGDKAPHKKVKVGFQARYVFVSLAMIFSLVFAITGQTVKLNAQTTGDEASPKQVVEACVEPAEVMRRDHMTFLLHQRDKTVYRGVRTKKYSLKQCIDCHVNTDTDGRFIPVNSQDQFCQGCHSYTSVKLDCFECHATTPDVAGADVVGNDSVKINGLLDQAWEPQPGSVGAVSENISVWAFSPESFHQGQ